MKRPDCDICGNSRMIRLPVRQRITTGPTELPQTVVATSRTFACPNCGDNVPYTDVAVLDTSATVIAGIDDPEFDRYARRTAAHQLVEFLLNGGYIRFEYGKVSDQDLTFQMTATLGVVAPGKVASIEDRITQRAKQIARSVVDASLAEIDNWGSGITDYFSKRDARYLIQEAYKSVTEKWSKTEVKS